MAKCVVLDNESRQGFDSMHSEFVARFAPSDGVTSVAAQPPLELMHHYETRLNRILQRALANLILMCSLQELNPPENIRLPIEPSPIFGHSAVARTSPDQTNLVPFPNTWWCRPPKTSNYQTTPVPFPDTSRPSKPKPPSQPTEVHPLDPRSLERLVQERPL
jgi:hypothetical protein